MAIDKITPRMRKALDDNVPLQYFAELQPSVLNDAVDTLSDFQASKQQSNMDFTTKPGYAQLAKQDDLIEQTAWNASLKWDVSRQSVTIPAGRFVESYVISVVLDSGGITDIRCEIWDETRENLLASSISGALGAFYTGDVPFYFTDLYLDSGIYWVYTLGPDPYSGELHFRYATIDQYAGGQFDVLLNDVWQINYGDQYFKLNMKKYYPSGSFRTRRIDLGATPPAAGHLQFANSTPADAGLTVNAEAYAAEADTSPAETITDAQDGQSLPAYRFWEFDAALTANAALDTTPIVDKLGAIHPKEELLLCEKDKTRLHVAADIRDNFHPLLENAAYTTSELKPLTRVSSGSSFTATLADTNNETIHRIISDNPLFNFPGTLYLGADVPGFSRADLLRVAVGTIRTVSFKPKYRRDKYVLSLTIKNPLLELQRKIPQIRSIGAVTLADTSINYEKTHCIDTALDATRGEADIDAGLVNIDSFIQGRDSVGPLFIVRRSNADGLPDTRHQSPVELFKFLEPLMIIGDGYITEDGDSRVSFVKHDVNAVPAAHWADEALVKAGFDAVPMEDVGNTALGYDTLLYNAALLGSEWDGSGGDWAAFGDLQSYIDIESVEEFGAGLDTYLSVMEQNLKEASKWLGPEQGYNGATIAATRAQQLVERFSYPPVIMTGVVVPNSQFEHIQGTVVEITSNEFVRFKRRRIALSETLKFIVLSKKPNAKRDRQVFKLMELK